MQTSLESLPERLRAKVKVENDCWLCGSNLRRYGQYSDQGRRYLAHRFVYELLVGPIPKGMQIDHLCRNRPCINPSHLEPVPPGENIRRGLSGYFGEKHKGEGARPWLVKSHCPKGHAKELQSGRLYCRVCYNVGQRQRYDAVQRQRRYQTEKYGYKP